MKKSILLLSLLCLTIGNAQKFKKIKGNQNIVSITRTTAAYEKISVAGSFDVKLVAGKEGTIAIKGDENLLEYIKTEINNNTLSVSFEKGKSIQYDYNSSIEITIPIETINQLTFSGSGNLSTTESINSEDLVVLISGSGNVKFESTTTNLKITKSGSGNLNSKGKTTNLEIISSGSGNANLSDLIALNAVATQSGSGNIKLNCTASLKATTIGSGNINYQGKPEKIDKNSTGSGSITGN
ncbi:head GIN domain-containing protein [Flavobacterium sp. SUN052]|uniref:head GIN domain-containing protein n=1 Tax=Flavobacterium sp. SUN052 TaxID=3002441 RepID=UPI00237EE6C0|nr:head GIN domain-containing protein [Flavobacterium sp. SUN052]MEC4003195.1 head GIN domain-containing protein [Flavobacterium sp. SUN052]